MTESRVALAAMAAEQPRVALAATAQWSDNSYKAGAVTLTACSPEGQPGQIFGLKLDNVRIPFEPSCYQGNGSETRLTICFSGIDEKLKQQLAAIEEDIGATTSCLKNDILRCKIKTDTVYCCDAQNMRRKLPKPMRGWTVNAHLWLRGKWSANQGCGLSIEATDLQFLGEGKAGDSEPDRRERWINRFEPLRSF
jgi:hypothetical protein